MGQSSQLTSQQLAGAQWRQSLLESSVGEVDEATKRVMTVDSRKTIANKWGSWARFEGLAAQDGSAARRQLP